MSGSKRSFEASGKQRDLAVLLPCCPALRLPCCSAPAGCRRLRLNVLAMQKRAVY